MPRLYIDIRQRCREMGIDLAYLAEKTGISKNSMARRMTGKLPWTLDEAYTILDVLKLSPDHLIKLFPRGGKAS